MNYYNEAVMQVFQLGVWDRMPDRRLKADKVRCAGPFRIRAAGKVAAGQKDRTGC